MRGLLIAVVLGTIAGLVAPTLYVPLYEQVELRLDGCAAVPAPRLSVEDAHGYRGGPVAASDAFVERWAWIWSFRFDVDDRWEGALKYEAARRLGVKVELTDPGSQYPVLVTLPLEYRERVRWSVVVAIQTLVLLACGGSLTALTRRWRSRLASA